MSKAKRTSAPAPKEQEARDQIFISYSWVDSLFAKWLAEALTREGFRVWLDRERLLGGERFTEEIKRTIDNKTHRLLALMSNASVESRNATRERTVADKAAKRLKCDDFIIPICFSDLGPSDLDFLTTDLVAIDFRDNWAAGLKQVITKLEKTGALRDQEKGPSHVAGLFAAQDAAELWGGPEEVFLNALSIRSLPEKLHLFRNIPSEKRSTLGIYFEDNSQSVWSFSGLPDTSPESTILTSDIFGASAAWPTTGARIAYVALLTKHFLQHLSSRGLQIDDWRRTAMFPLGFVADDKIKFKDSKGRITSCQTVGLRTSGYRDGSPVRFRYHLAVKPNLSMEFLKTGKVHFTFRVEVFDLNGRPFKRKMVISRRKKATRGWYNHQWLQRFTAAASWLVGEKETVIFDSPCGNFSLSPGLVRLNTTFSLNEEALAGQEIEEDPFDDNESGDDVNV